MQILLGIVGLIVILYLSWQLLKLTFYLVVALFAAIGEGLLLLWEVIAAIFIFLWTCIAAFFKGIWIVLVFLAQCIWTVLTMVIAVVVSLVTALAVGIWVTFEQIGFNISYYSRYDKWTWWKKEKETARRNYFFGPGYAKLANVVSEIASDLWDEVRDVSWRYPSKKLGWLTDHIPDVCETVAYWIYKVVGRLTICLLGAVLDVMAALFWGICLTTVLLVLCVPVTCSWVIDELGLWRRRPRADCPACKHHSRRPAFQCECGRIHRNLRPGAYGILRHRCKCGKKLPCAFLSGRTNLKTVCPVCDAVLAASDARPLVFHMIGGTRSGKTAYVTALFHQMAEQVNGSKRLSFKLADMPGSSFNDMMQWYRGTPCPETVRRNGQMYAMLIDGLSVRRQLSVFDITGNVFGGTVETDEMPQLAWCDGLLLVIDPFCGTNLPKPPKTAVSNLPTEMVVSQFICHMTYAGHMKATARCTIPLTVLIAKADEQAVRNVLSPAKIAAAYDDNPGQYAGLDDARNVLCRNFLLDIGLNAAVSELEAQFTHIRYYPVSAQGHASDGTAFEPWGVTEAMEWMLARKDRRLVKVLAKKQ